MRTKKYVIALAIFGGMLFTAYSENIINLDAEQTAKMPPRNVKRPTKG